MKFSEMPYSRPDLEAMKANLTACTEAFLAAESAQEQIAQYDRVTDLSVEFNTMGSFFATEAKKVYLLRACDSPAKAACRFFSVCVPAYFVVFAMMIVSCY